MQIDEDRIAADDVLLVLRKGDRRRLNEGFPGRYRLDGDKIEDIVVRYSCTSKRTLLLRLRRAWREFGIPRRSGFV